MPEAIPRPFRPRTIRIQLTLAIIAVVAIVTALTGAFVVLHADRNDRAVIDRALTTRVGQVRAAAAKTGALPTDGSFAVRLLDGTDVRAEKGATTKFSIPVRDGFSTVTAADGSHWRSWAETLKTGAQLQVLISLAQAEERHDGNVRMINLAVLLAALIAGLGTWLVAGLVLRPLIRQAASADPGEPRPASEPDAEPDADPGQLSAIGFGTPASAGSDAPTATLPRIPAATPDKSDKSGKGGEGGGRSRADEDAAQAVERATQAVEWATQADALAAQATAKATHATAKATEADERAATAAAQAAAATTKAKQADERAAQAAAKVAAAEARAQEMTERAEQLQSELDRLRGAKAGTAAAERLAGEVGGMLREPLASLGAELDQILDSPDMSAMQRHLLLAAIQNEHRRMVDLVDEFESQSRGEAPR